MSRVILILSTIIGLTIVLPSSAAPPQHQPTGQQPSDFEVRIKELITKEVADRISESGEAILQRAEDSVRQVELLISVVRGWLTVVSLIFAFLIFVGWTGLRLLEGSSDRAKRAAEEASASSQRAKQAEDDVKASADRLKEIDRATLQAIDDLKTYVERLPAFAKLAIIGELPELPEEIHKFEEADIIIVIAERTKAIEPLRLAESFASLGGYWRLVGNYPRSIARFRKALELNASLGEAHLGLCFTLFAFAGEKMVGATLKKRLLDEAESECNKAIQILGKGPRSMFALGWIYDERGAFDQAANFYLEARELDKEGKFPNVTYNLACTYSKAGRSEGALRELEKVMHLDRNWEDAEVDPDLKGLREDPEYGPRLRAIAEKAMRESQAPSS